MSDGFEIDGDTLVLAGGTQVRFIRTLRLPEQGEHPLPPGLGEFPIRRVEDHRDTVPAAWAELGGVMIPMYTREAMWLSFRAGEPAALQVGVGKVCAVSGETWQDELSQDPQNYLTLPRQPWLDGLNSGEGTVRQFVAVPHGLGATVEGQVTGEEVHGGVQLALHRLTEEKREEWERERSERPTMRGVWGSGFGDDAVHADALFDGSIGAVPMAAAMAAPPPPASAVPESVTMGIGAGGRMTQEIYEDDRDVTEYEPVPSSRVFVHLCSASQWETITGEKPPPTPISASTYTEHGYPWFQYFDAEATDLAPAENLESITPVGEWLGADGEDQPLHMHNVVGLKDA